MPAAFAVITVLIAAVCAGAVEVDYSRDIKPLLHEKCSACHGALKQEAGLRLDAAAMIRAGGDSGSAINSDEALASPLIARVISRDSADRMPPEGEGEPLTSEQVERLLAWISAGAKGPPMEEVLEDPRDHWAYQVPQRPIVPAGQGAGHPIDAFILRSQQTRGVNSIGLAEKRTVVRRLYFDLIGLPPTPQQIDAFLIDATADSYARLVDQLLSSPQFGERWGRHWMDVWRYSDWNGYKDQLRGSQRHIWRWRDWIIESLNADKGYDQMIIEMLAGDEVAPEDPDVLRATGFLARNYHKSNRNIWLDATVEHTAKAFLGLTINCAKCHDHKYDPITQSEYYALRAVFEPHHVRTERITGQRSVQKDGLPRVYDADPQAKTYVYIRGNEKHFDKNDPVSPAIPAVFKELLKIKPVSLPPVAVFPALWPQIEGEDIAAAKQRVATLKKQLQTHRKRDPVDCDSIKLTAQKLESEIKTLDSLKARWTADRAKFGGVEVTSRDSDTHIAALARTAAEAEREANWLSAKLAWTIATEALSTAKSSGEKDEKKKAEAVDKASKTLAAADKRLKEAEVAKKKENSDYTSVGKSYPSTSTGRRLALANWIASPSNPLTARVAVNYLWLHHFGEPLVSSTFDFGLRCPKPVHAELLDWLAMELIENDWSLKHIHRLIVTSKTYQQSSSSVTRLAAENQRRDADNHFFWRANVRRLDAELIRDSMLSVAGSLDLTQGGADIDHALGETVPRRSIYFRHAYEKQMTMLVLFDAAGPNECYRRSESIVPQQARTLANSNLSLSQSRRLAQTICKQSEQPLEDDASFIQQTFLQLLGREPSDQERSLCESFLSEQASLLNQQESLTQWGGKNEAAVKASSNPKMRALENLVHVLMNHNDFVTVR